MKVKVQKLDGSDGSRATSSSTMPCSASSRAPTSCTASSPGSSRTAAAPPAPTRERSDVARTGKKFGRQKGGGTARHGDRAAPIFIGGGKAHGARQREFDISLNKKIRALGLQDGAVGKAKDGLVVVDSLELTDAKTKALKGQLRQDRLERQGAGDRRRRGRRRLRAGRRQPAGRQRAAGGRRQRLRHPEA